MKTAPTSLAACAALALLGAAHPADAKSRRNPPVPDPKKATPAAKGAKPSTKSIEINSFQYGIGHGTVATGAPKTGKK